MLSLTFYVNFMTGIKNLIFEDYLKHTHLNFQNAFYQGEAYKLSQKKCIFYVEKVNI